MTDLAMTRGDTKTVTVTVGPAGLGAGGITGWSFWFTAKHDPGDADTAAVVQKLPAAWQIQTAGSSTVAGVAFCVLAPGDTSALPAYQSNLTYDIQGKDTNGNIFTLDSGAFTVSADITTVTS